MKTDADAAIEDRCVAIIRPRDERRDQCRDAVAGCIGLLRQYEIEETDKDQMEEAARHLRAAHKALQAVDPEIWLRLFNESKMDFVRENVWLRFFGEWKQDATLMARLQDAVERAERWAKRTPSGGRRNPYELFKRGAVAFAEDLLSEWGTGKRLLTVAPKSRWSELSALLFQAATGMHARASVFERICKQKRKAKRIDDARLERLWQEWTRRR
jgi:hypothetical protein